MMAFKLFISAITLFIIFGCYSTAKEIELKTVGEDKIYSAKLSSCSIGAAELKDIIQCKGEKGYQGVPGAKGSKGDAIQGPIGSPGSKGEKGDRGDTGAPGIPGLEGMNVPGPKGEWGDPGWPGDSEKGNQGPTGPQGVMGLTGTCLQEIKIETDSDEVSPLESIGTEGNPANFLCHTTFVDEEENKKRLTGDIWVFKGDHKFQVRCEAVTNRTCLIIKPQKEIYMHENSFNYKKEEKPFWFSQKNFNLTKFYNDVTKKQIAWLQSKSTQVAQKVRYHCKNSYVAEYIHNALGLLSWNDVTIGPFTTDYSPMSYSLPPKSHGCTEEAPANEWGYSDIVVTGSSKRLPVIDFHIRDVRKEDQRFYLELTELCFG